MFKISKEKIHSISEIGVSNALFYGYAFNGGKRIGTVWRFKDNGRYAMNEDFDRCKHSKDNRPIQIVASNLRELKNKCSEYYK